MISLDLRGSKPIYEQIVEQMKRNISKGYLKPGDAIPSVRRMALELTITPGTVAKAYQELERQKLIETIRGKGTFVASQKQKMDDDRVEQIRRQLASEVLELKLMGIKREEIAELFNEIYDEL
ncbi:MAG: GntR family transcriptional regulator [Lachnospiraceae bacterium]|nr:GntR family transcriptional regulator [Lachnospiraceae bacterium]